MCETSGELRSSAETLLAMRQSEQLKKHVFGVKGVSALVRSPKFQNEKYVPIDFMHNICLGVVKYMTEIWCDSKNNKMDFYLGLKVNNIDRRIVKYKTYTEISRYPQEMKLKSQWKANEWLNWLLYYFCPSLLNFLPQIYFKHFQKLRKVIRLLLNDDLND